MRIYKAGRFGELDRVEGSERVINPNLNTQKKLNENTKVKA